MNLIIQSSTEGSKRRIVNKRERLLSKEMKDQKKIDKFSKLVLSKDQMTKIVGGGRGDITPPDGDGG